MKVAFGMIVFEGDYFLSQVLTQIYPFASQILIAEGPVTYFQQLGRETSTDNTNNILKNFPDPDGKLIVVKGQYKEKDEQCRAYLQHLDPDTDYLWSIDADEVYKTIDIQKVIDYISTVRPTSIGMRSLSFFGGFSDHLTGFEFRTDNFLRIFKVVPGVRWKSHRPPTMLYPDHLQPTPIHISSDQLWKEVGVQMYHYSYVFPRQVYRKVKYYAAVVSRERCIQNYFDMVYTPWVLGSKADRVGIERAYHGVHEFIPEVRGPCYTEPFTGIHPEAILSDFASLSQRLDEEVEMLRDDPLAFLKVAQ